MDLSIVILTWNSGRYIEGCLRSLVASLAPTGLTYEILVVDNGSSDLTAAVLRRVARDIPDRLVVQYLRKNLGTTVSRNIALRNARGEHICLMDSDVEVPAGIFPGLIRFLGDNAGVGLAVPRICYPSGLVQKSCDRFPTLLHKIHRFFRLRSMELKEAAARQAATGSFPVDYAISAFWLFRRELLKTVGFLDEKIFYAPEDVDFCLRIWKAGYRIMYVPTVVVIHHTQEISRGWRLNRSKLSHLKGLVYFFAKHRYLFRIPQFKSIP